MEATVSYLLMLKNKSTQSIRLGNKDSDYTLCLGNISKYFTINNIKKKTRIKGIVQIFSVDFNPADTNDVLDIYKYLMKRT